MWFDGMELLGTWFLDSTRAMPVQCTLAHDGDRVVAGFEPIADRDPLGDLYAQGLALTYSLSSDVSKLGWQVVGLEDGQATMPGINMEWEARRYLGPAAYKELEDLAYSHFTYIGEVIGPDNVVAVENPYDLAETARGVWREVGDNVESRPEAGREARLARPCLGFPAETPLDVVATALEASFAPTCFDPRGFAAEDASGLQATWERLPLPASADGSPRLGFAWARVVAEGGAYFYQVAATVAGTPHPLAQYLEDAAMAVQFDVPMWNGGDVAKEQAREAAVLHFDEYLEHAERLDFCEGFGQISGDGLANQVAELTALPGRDGTEALLDETELATETLGLANQEGIEERLGEIESAGYAVDVLDATESQRGGSGPCQGGRGR